MSNHELVERFWEKAGFKVHIVHLSEIVINDKLAVLSDGSGRITFARYEMFLLDNCILDKDKVLNHIYSLESTPEDMIDAAIELRNIIIDVNPLLDPELLIFNDENVIKILSKNDLTEEEGAPKIRRIIENPDWDKPEFDGPTEEELELFFDSLPEPEMPPGFNGKDLSDPDKTAVIDWEEGGHPVVILKYSKKDLPDIFKDKYVFPHEEAYRTYIVTQCVFDFPSLFMVLETISNKVEELGGAEGVITKLYEFCIEHNKFLAWDVIDLEKVKRLVYRKHGKPSSRTPTKPPKSGCSSCKSEETEEEDYREFEDLSEEEILSLRERMKVWVIGQDEAVNTICESVELASCGMKELNSPIGVYMLTGESGCGKTHSARVLCQELCGDEHSMVRIDCSEYAHSHEVSKLMGSPPGYIGHDDTPYFVEALKRQPFTVVLFDEIEKAHSKFYDILLQIMDEGRLTTNKGEVLTFGQAVILMTSNLGVKEVNSISNRVGIGNASKLTHSKRERAIKEALKNKFKPEFLNRLDGVVTFNSLTKDNCLEIVKLAFRKLNEWTNEKNIDIKYTDNVIEYLYKVGFSSGFGARPLKRAMKKEIMLPISKYMLKDGMKKDCVINIDCIDNKLTFEIEKKEIIETVEEEKENCSCETVL